ncbi:MAG: hypothetical protein WC877_05585 [Dehalococcoidales bacterium]|jgi:hypothetical protein
MTAMLETTIQRWNGQDGDQVTITDVREGSTFHAVDTGRRYVYHNGGWAEDLRDIYVAEHV